jgi:hypothetical protein
VTFYTSEANGWGVGTAITFEGWDESHGDNEPSLPALLGIVESDPRVSEVAVEPDTPATWVTVKVHPDPVRMDLRDGFGLTEAYDILTKSETDGE